MEGGHRKAGNFQANFCAQLDAENGSILECLTYKTAHFKAVGLTPVKRVSQEDIIGAYNSAIKDGSKSKGFFYHTTTVLVR